MDKIKLLFVSLQTVGAKTNSQIKIKLFFPVCFPSFITIDTALVDQLRDTDGLRLDKTEEAFRTGVPEKAWTIS